jgi:hypothetical protein
MTDPQPDIPGTAHRLVGLEPDTLLAFLALLGLLRALETARPHWHPRAHWDPETLPLRPVLTLADPATQAEVAAAAAEGCETLARDYDFEGRGACNYTGEAFAALVRDLLRVEDAPNLGRIALMSSLAHESCLKPPKSKTQAPEVARSTFNCLDVASVQFLKSLRLATEPHARQTEQIAAALFAPWTRSDRFTTFRWDTAEDRRHAHRFKAPTDDPVRTEAGAIRLAAIGMAALPGIATERRGRPELLALGSELGEGRGGRAVTWPIWARPASLATLKALLALPALADTEPDRAALQRRGIIGLRRSHKTQLVDRYFNFTRAQAL